MGRKSGTTKSGKYINPTDQARKEARKKELKKNKKQRLLVRTAVLKNKDPSHILYELDKLDELEYNPTAPPPLADKVLKDKRKKLRETLERVMKLYQKEDAVAWNNFKQCEADYERRRFQRIQYFEAVKQAEQINVDDIPLPPSLGPPLPGGSTVEDIPLPGESTSFSAPPSSSSFPSFPSHQPSTFPVDPHSILKNASYGGKEPPGVPPEDPSDLSDIELSDDEDEEKVVVERAPLIEKSVRFSDPTPAAASSETTSKGVEAKDDTETLSEMDRFMREVEELSKDELKPPGTIETDPSAPPLPPGMKIRPPIDDEDEEEDDEDEEARYRQNHPFSVPPPPQLQRPMFGQFMPPGPPPRIRFNVPPPPGMGGMMRVPPPPSYLQQPPQRQQFQNRQMFRPPRSQFNSNPSLKSDSKLVSNSSMIEAKPQIRSLSADVTRFVPMSVKTKKEDDKPKSKTDFRHMDPYRHQPPIQQQPQPKTKDDAYMEFMSEMEGLM